MTDVTTSPTPLVRHCSDPYKACCLPWGWCNCICGKCQVAKYVETEKRNAANDKDDKRST